MPLKFCQCYASALNQELCKNCVTAMQLHAKRLEMYGIALHPGKDSHGRAIQLGVTCIGNFTKKVNLTEKVNFSKKVTTYLISRRCKKLASIRSCNIPIKI